MSLTFDFPSWKVQVESHGEDGGRVGGGGATRAGADHGKDWAADLDDLESEDGGEDGAGPGTAQATGEEGHGASGGPGPAHPVPEPLSQPSGLRGEPGGGPSTSAGALPPAACVGAAAGTRGPRPAPAAAISGDAIPSEVLLLVLSQLRDVGDCVRAALVCRHWLGVVALSNELWFELASLHSPNGTWHCPPHAGRPLLRPPPGCDHPRSRMLSYKTTCALTSVAVRFMALRKGFEYVVEAAASLWLAVEQAAAAQGQPGPQGQGQAPGPQGQQGQAAAEQAQEQGQDQASAADGTASAMAALGSPGGTAPAADAGSAPPAAPPPSRPRRISHVDQLWEGGRSRTALQVDERFNAVRVQAMVGKLCSAGAGAGQWLQLYEGVAGLMASRADEIRDRLASAAAAQEAAALKAALAAACPPSPSGASGPAPTGDPDPDTSGAAVSSSVLAPWCLAPTTAVAPTPSSSAAAYPGPSSRAGAPGAGAGASAAQAAGSSPAAATAGGGASHVPVLRGEVVYGGGGYAATFAELLRRGDTRGALALAEARPGQRGGGGGGGAGEGAGRAAAELGRTEVEEGGGGGGGGVGGGGWWLEEEEMREVVELAEEGAGDADAEVRRAVGGGGGGGGSTGVATATARPPAAVELGLELWRQLLRWWGLYRRWLEVWVVWCAPLAARVEAERQLAGAAARPGEAPLAAPHLTNKGLQLFRSQVVLAYPLRRPLQAAALWLSARAAAVAAADAEPGAFLLGGGGGGGLAGGGGGAGGGGMGSGGGGGGGAPLAPLSEEHWGLLRSIRKALTELAVPDDATQPPAAATRAKLQRCFGRLLLRPQPGGTRALAAAQRAAALGGGGLGGGSGRGGFCR
ncbi:hypothetical protein HYH03_009209 [Edaphochlamys debaryana]|uniref:F-box domain-containing protein n=1 Tax=Edaphochlamys debaryana TaxID=47281 RepID=A0A835Y7R1_9CHLO|nr:hypothetical protein HYH03_009209 [Edaphochlamys debaryana]|eukprot:KAG2492544.1 hypothetical protein HYH03_009209 [Edaphochlamys debaryana]